MFSAALNPCKIGLHKCAAAPLTRLQHNYSHRLSGMALTLHLRQQFALCRIEHESYRGPCYLMAYVYTCCRPVFKIMSVSEFHPARLIHFGIIIRILLHAYRHQHYVFAHRMPHYCARTNASHPRYGVIFQCHVPVGHSACVLFQELFHAQLIYLHNQLSVLSAKILRTAIHADDKYPQHQKFTYFISLFAEKAIPLQLGCKAPLICQPVTI